MIDLTQLRAYYDDLNDEDSIFDMVPANKTIVLALIDTAEAAIAAEELWNVRMQGASIVIPGRDDPDQLTQAWFRLNDTLNHYTQ